MEQISHSAIDEEVAILRDRVRQLEQQLSQRAASSEMADHSAMSQLAFDSVPDAIMVFDAETKQFVDANEAVLQLYGYTREEFLELNHTDITAEPEESRISFQQLLAGKLSRIPVRHHKKKDGTVFPVEISASRFDNAGQTLFCGAIRDISERVQAEERADTIMRAVVEGTASATGEEFFKAFAQALASVFGSRYVLVCEHLDAPATRVRTHAFWMADHFGKNIEYDLAGGPCEETAIGELTFHPEGLQALFPEEKDLVDLGAESYCGIPLTDSMDQLIGHLAIMDDRPMSADICDLPALQVFVARAAAELERARMEQELRESEHRLRLVTDSLPAFISYLDADRRYQFVNRHYQEQFGIKQEDIVGKHPREVLGESYYQGIAHHLDAVFAGTHVKYESTMEIEGKGKRTLVTQHIPDVTPHGKVRGVFNFVTDISDRKEAEEAVRASEVRTRAMLEGSPVCIKIVDLDFKLQYMSTAGQTQLKICNIVPFYGSSFPPDLYPEPWRAAVIELLKRAKAGETCSLECPVLDTEGEEVWFDTTFVPDRDQEGRVQQIIVTSVNITDRRQAEEEARKRRDELAHVSRINTMGEMATALAHELNQPLAAVANYAFAMEESLKSESKIARDPQRRSELVKKINAQAVRAGDIVRRMRNFLRNSDSHRTRSDINHVLREAVALVEPEAHERSATFKLLLGNNLPTIMVDDVRIQQILVNLIRNALDAMNQTDVDQRIVRITTSLDERHFVEIVVQDFGIGICSDDFDRLFDTFFTTKHAGMGMGLAISRSIAEEHNGRLWCDPNVSQGAIFRFTIPTILAESERGGSDAS